MPIVAWDQVKQGLGQLGSTLANQASTYGNQANQVLHDSIVHIGNALRPAPPPHVDQWATSGFPSYMHDNAEQHGMDSQRLTYARTMLGNYDPKTLPPQMNELHVYRADPTGKFGGKDGLETMPTKFGTPGQTNFSMTGNDPIEAYTYARQLARAGKYGVPQLSAQELAALVLKEGRTDFGFKMADWNNKHSDELINRLSGGTDERNRRILNDDSTLRPIHFAATVAEKAALAKRLNIPFAEAWNGTGQNSSGTTGAQYAKGYEYALKAAQNPKNAALVQLIQAGLAAGAKDQ